MRLGAALAAEARAWRMALSQPVFYLLMGLLALGLIFAPNLPLVYSIDVGRGEGYGGDLPYLRDFNTSERNHLGAFRWTADASTIVVPGVGRRTLLVQLAGMPLAAETFAQAPQRLEVWSGAERLAVLPLRMEGGNYRLMVPARLLPDGDLTLTLRSATFTPPDDPRRLGMPLDRIQVASLAGEWPVAPNWEAVGRWLLAGLFAWATLLRALGPLPTGRRWAAVAMAGLALLTLLAAVLDLPRWAFGAQAVLTPTLLGYGLALLLRPALRGLAARLRIPLPAVALAGLTLIVVVAFGLRYGGRLYPESMPGDIGFHNNRFEELVYGRVYLLSRNRGVDFPYPPGPYLLAAPFTLSGFQPTTILPFGAALIEALSAVLVYALVARGAPGVGARTALLAAAIYVFTAAGFMTSWWSFSTHIYTQFAALLLVTVTVLTLGDGSRAPVRAWPLIGVAMTLVFLGHFGFFINTALLGAMLTALVWLASWRGVSWARALRWPLTLTYGAALLFALVCFYSAYLWLFLFQAQATATGGLTGLADRDPVERTVLWQVLWEAGLIQHFGFFPLALALPGLALLIGRVRRAGAAGFAGPPPGLTLTALMAGSFLISAGFALLPFITLSTQSTRWLMFSAWAVAVGAALAAHALWRCGRAGRLAVVAMGGFVVWNTAVFWLGPMLWRIRPPEPF